MATDSALRLGIDLGGTKIEAALLDPTGDIIWRHRIPAPRDAYPATIKAVERLVHQARAMEPSAVNCSIGIGIPGSLSPRDGRVRNANSTWLNGQPFKRDLEAALRQTVQMANDANCLAVSEATDGAACDAQSVFAVILGTGVGGAHVIHKQLVTGANGVAGEWGHTPLPWMTAEEFKHAPCWCGRSGCIETFLSGPALVQEFNTSGHAKVESVQEILGMADPANRQALALMERFYDRLARALAMVINIIDPEVIVIGGGLSNIASIYSEIPKRWGRWIFSDMAAVTRLVPALHGDASGVRGAAWL
ncbi:MAG: ROK family protein [Burkholderiaceae bacterium]|nr:ROK family protein [Burkholderiaceae bacterium]